VVDSKSQTSRQLDQRTLAQKQLNLLNRAAKALARLALYEKLVGVTQDLHILLYGYATRDK
jgi:hypothetical protein